MHKTIIVLTCALALISCKPTEAEKASKQAVFQKLQEKQCLNQICEGDILPRYDPATEFPFKVGGKIFIGPKEYGGYGGSFAFFWPSKSPRHQTAPEFVPSGPGINSNFYEVGIEIFMRAKEGPTSGLSMYDLLLRADAEGRVLSKTTLREGLQAWRTRDEISKTSFVIWYVATELKDDKGHPPVLACDGRDPKFARCTMAFVWQPGIVVDMRFRAKHGSDWPEIYQETVRVLQLIKKV